MFDPGSEVIISWDFLTSVGCWRGVIIYSDGGSIGFERADGIIFEVNPRAVRLMYIRYVGDTMEANKV